MNWVDIVLMILLVAALVVGSKKGLIRELMALLVLTTAVILSVNYIDVIAGKVYEQLGGSPLVTAIISFVLLLAFIYAIFKLLAMAFYKVANMQKLGKKDQLGGALVGFVRGWVIISFFLFLVFLMPMPEKFYVDFESSLLGPTFAKTLPVLYEGSSGLHPENPQFMPKIETTLLQRPSGSMTQEERDKLSSSREQVYRVIYEMDRFFGSKQ